MKIGELANTTGLSTRTVRFYEKVGLLPDPDRKPNGYRHYEVSTVDRLRFIRDAQASGLTLAEIGLILDMKDHGESTCDHVVSMLDGHISSVDRQIDELIRTRARLAEMAERGRAMDPATCRDSNRCQTIGSHS